VVAKQRRAHHHSEQESVTRLLQTNRSLLGCAHTGAAAIPPGPRPTPRRLRRHHDDYRTAPRLGRTTPVPPAPTSV
jgi:hypothetical protein